MDTNEMQETQYFEIDKQTLEVEDRFTPSAASAKIERRYELQRKIDEELRKLQFTEAMEQPEDSQKGNGADVVVPNDMDIAGKSENLEKSLSNGANDNILDKSVTQETAHAASPDEINTCQEKQLDGDEKVEVNGMDSVGFIDATSQESDNITNDVAVVHSELDDEESDYVANSSTMTSPTTTTGTYTLPTHSPGTEEDLPEDIFLIDQAPSTFRDQLPVVSATSPQGMDVSEMSSDVFLGQKLSQSLSNTEIGSEETFDQPEVACDSTLGPVVEDSDKDNQAQHMENANNIDDYKHTENDTEIVPPTVILPEIESKEDVKLSCDNIEISTVEPPVEFCGDGIVQENAAIPETAEDVSQEETEVKESANVPEVQTSNNDGGEIMLMEAEETSDNNIVGTLIVDKADSSSYVEETKLTENEPESKIVEQVIDDALEGKINTEEELKKVEQEVASTHHEVANDQEMNDVVVDGKISLDEEFDDAQFDEVPTSQEIISDVADGKQITEQDFDDTRVEEISTPQEATDDDRKISTDDDEYSGYDIDICEPTSYQEEVSLGAEADDVTSETSSSIDENMVTKPYNLEGESLFVDVKYSVGNQLNDQEGQIIDDTDDVTPTEEKENLEYPEIVPWGSDGVLLPVDNQSQNESFRSDKEETNSLSSKSTLSDTVAYVEQSEKIAEDTVKTAIEAAYEIMRNIPDKDENEEINSTEESIDNHDEVTTERNDYQMHSAENPTLNKVETEITSERTLPDIEGARLTPLEDDDNSTESTELTSEKATVEVAAKEAVEVEQSTEVEVTSAQNDNSIIITQGDISNKDEHNANIPEVLLDAEHTDSISQAVGVNSEQNKDLPVENLEDLKEQENEKMVKIHEENGAIRDLPDRITYSPAHSQRNIEATKWFGQSTSEDKIWMKPKGKVDENAEQERKKLIKAMTRKHNSKLIPKWQPPVEKDPTEDLDAKQKASLKKYEERRRTKSDAAFDNGNYTYQPAVATVSEATLSPNTEQQPALRENIVIESVVHSKDAINVWESRLSEKQHKENLERQRLSVGKQKKRVRASSDVTRQRRDSNSSVSSNSSTVLPTSEHIERESMNVSKVRNRWRNIEEETSKTKSPTHFTKQPGRRSFIVNAPQTFRSNQKPSPAKTHPQYQAPIATKTHHPPIITSAVSGESFIDREIREAAEREERWKQEQWEKASAASSEDVFPDQHLPPPSNTPAVDTVGLDILNDAGREEIWKEERLHMEEKKSDPVQRNPSKDSSGIGSITGSEILSPPPQFARKSNKDLDMESLSSYGSSETGNELPSPPSLSTMAQDKIDFTKKVPEYSTPNVHQQNLQDSTDSGIECSGVKSPAAVPKSPTQEEEALLRRQRLASLTSVVAPKGWKSDKGRTAGPVTPFVHRSVPIPEAKSTPSPLSPISLPPEPVPEPVTVVTNSAPVATTPPKIEQQPKTETNHTEKAEPPTVTKQEQHTKTVEAPKEKTISSPKREDFPAARSGGPVFRKAGPILITSNTNQLQTVMEREMQEAAAREEEWRQQQLGLVNQGVDVTAHHVVHSSREIRTPTSSAAPPPVNAGGEKAPEPRVVKSLFADDGDESPAQFTEDSNKEYQNRALKKALKMPKRKSTLAMRWEEGNFQNNVPEKE